MSAENKAIESGFCLHCNQPSENRFCCPGCESAHLAAGYIPNQNFIPYVNKDQEGNSHLTVFVEGIHCASCIQLIEKALYAEKAVLSARVNMSTARLNITWRGKDDLANYFADKINNLGYKVKNIDEDELEDKSKVLLLYIAIAGFAMGNLMLISTGLWSASESDMGVATREFLHWISALIALPAIVFTARPFFHSAYKALKGFHTNMDVPISVAIILASLMSLFETINNGAYIYFESVLMLIFFLLTGRYLDERAKGKARQSAADLLAVLKGSATIIENKKHMQIPIRDLKSGMVMLVAKGEKVAADGVIENGLSEFDISLISGESLPKLYKKGDEVFSGMVNLSGPVTVKVSKASEDSLISQIVKIMEQGQQSQAKYVRLADKAARLYTPVVHFFGLLTFLHWCFIASIGWQPALLNAITVLIITCPCALGLAVPVVQVLASNLLMKSGVLLKSGDALEKMAKVTTAVFDKTGTLTSGQLRLVGNYSKDDLKFAASLAVNSRHPLAKAIKASYDGKLYEVKDVEEIPGEGLKTKFAGKLVKLGSRKFCDVVESKKQFGIELWLKAGERKVCFKLEDEIRDHVHEVIAYFKSKSIKTIILSGDNKINAGHIAKLVGVDEYHAQLSPIDKSDYLKKLKLSGESVLMVGDGINDAPSLSLADISISPSSAIDISQNSADVVFQGNSFYAVCLFHKIACFASKLVKQNFLLAVIYNIIAIPLAVMGYVTPLVAAICMSLSSLVVIGNSFRLREGRRE